MIQIPTSFNEFTPTYAKELCIKAKKGELPTHERRLTKLEKLSVQPNTCYIYLKSKIKRWTDGLDWSPSRISDCFLVYKSDNLIRKNISFKDLNLSVCAYFPNLCGKKEKMIFNLENYKSEKFKNFIVNFHNFEPTNLINTQLMQNKSNTNPLQRDLFYNFKVKKELKLKEYFEDINLSLDSKTNSEIENQPNSSIISDSFFVFDMNKNVF